MLLYLGKCSDELYGFCCLDEVCWIPADTGHETPASDTNVIRRGRQQPAAVVFRVLASVLYIFTYGGCIFYSNPCTPYQRTFQYHSSGLLGLLFSVYFMKLDKCNKILSSHLIHNGWIASNVCEH